jgi:DNA-binding transcriptional regulator GbsR (MarR family)
MNNNTSYIDEIELNNYIQKLNYFSESIKSNLNEIYAKSNEFLETYSTHNRTKIQENIEEELSNIKNITLNNEKYIETLITAINRYNEIEKDVSRILEQG